jgi:transposase InsO family protein
MRYRFIDKHRGEHKVRTLCRVMEVSTSGFYAWRSREDSQRERSNRRLLIEIKVIHARSKRSYGSPRIYEALVQEEIECSLNRVARLMREGGVQAYRPARFTVTTDGMHLLQTAPNLLNRQFEPDGPNQVWVADITYVATRQGWLYVAVVIDLYSRFVVGYAMHRSIQRQLVIEAMEMALRHRGSCQGLIHHSDRGSQYASEDYQNLLKKHGMLVSMSRRGNCWDNAPAESFFATLKKELIHQRQHAYKTRLEASRDISQYIETWYNRQRLHSSLGYMSPAAYEAKQNEITKQKVA